jgi:hypothetical protein
MPSQSPIPALWAAQGNGKTEKKGYLYIPNKKWP